MIFEHITEELLNEKLITYGNRKPYGQVVFIAGGAGSGKGFAISNFIDSSGFKVRDVDEMKKQIQRLNKIDRLSIDSIIDRFGRNMKQKDVELLRQLQDEGYTLNTLNLKNPDHVYALHKLVKATGIKETWLSNILVANSNPNTLPNIMFDMTLKEVNDITSVVPSLIKAGYNPKNISLTWVLADYKVAIERNKNRDRVVPEDILIQTHEGAANTVWGLLTKGMPKGVDGRADVILNNQEHTVFFTDERGKPIKTKQGKLTVKGFLSLPIKKQGGGFYPESLWQDKLYRWIKKNAPDTLTHNMREVNESSKSGEWVVYTGDTGYKENIVAVKKSNRAAKMLMNKLWNSGKYHKVGIESREDWELTWGKIK